MRAVYERLEDGSLHQCEAACGREPFEVRSGSMVSTCRGVKYNRIVCITIHKGGIAG